MNKLTIDSDQSATLPTDSGNFFFSPSKQQLYKKLMAGFEEKKILITLTGEAGLGKTFLMEQIINELGDRAWLIKVHLQSHTKCGEFFNIVAKELEIDLSNKSTLTEKGALLIKYISTLPEQHVIIQVDQAQIINPEALERIIDWIILISAEFDYTPIVHLVLLGLPALDEMLEQVGLTELGSRQISHNKIKPLSDSEIQEYIQFYLKRSGGDAKLFEKSALEGVAYYSKGKPRLINKLCDLGLLTASLDEHPTVTTEIINEVAEQCLSTEFTPLPAEIHKSDLDEALTTDNGLDEPVVVPAELNDALTADNSLDEPIVVPAELDDALTTDNSFDEPIFVPAELDDALTIDNNLEKTIDLPTDLDDALTAGNSLEETIDLPTDLDDALTADNSLEETIDLPTDLDDALTTDNSLEETIDLPTDLDDALTADNSLEETIDLPTDLDDILKIDNDVKEMHVPPIDVDGILAVDNYVEDTHVSSTELKNSDVNIAYPVNTSRHSGGNKQSTRKSFIFGLIATVMFCIAAVLNLKDEELQNELPSDSQNQVAKSEQAEKMVQSEKPSTSRQQDTILNKLQSLSDKVSQPDKQSTGTINKAESQGSNQIQTMAKSEENNFSKQVILNQKIVKLMNRAEQQIAKKQLMTPLEDSAWQTYKDILRLDPENEKAKLGIDNITETYVRWAWFEIQKNNLDSAEMLFRKALIISEDDKDAASGLVWLEKYRNKN